MAFTEKVDAPTPDAGDLTAFQKNILTILAEEARYGLAVKRELEEYYGEEVNHGRLYPNLDDLVKKGFVEKSELDKRTNSYALTPDGRDVLFADLSWQLEKIARSGSRAELILSVVEKSRGDA